MRSTVITPVYNALFFFSYDFGGMCRKVFDTESVRQGKCSTRKLFDNVVDDLNTQPYEQLDIVDQFPCRTLPSVPLKTWVRTIHKGALYTETYGNCKAHA